MVLMDCVFMDWIQLAEDRDRCRAVVNGDKPFDSIKGGEFD